MDAKNIRNHTFWLETDEEKKRPEAWRYWRALPGKGEMAVFFGGWYSEPIRKFCCGGLDENDFNRRMQRWAGWNAHWQHREPDRQILAAYREESPQGTSGTAPEAQGPPQLHAV